MDCDSPQYTQDIIKFRQYKPIWGGPINMGTPIAGGFKMENPTKMDDLKWKILLKWMI